MPPQTWKSSGLCPWDDACSTRDSQDTALGAGMTLSPHHFKAFFQGILTLPSLLQQHHGLLHFYHLKGPAGTFPNPVRSSSGLRDQEHKITWTQNLVRKLHWICDSQTFPWFLQRPCSSSSTQQTQGKPWLQSGSELEKPGGEETHKSPHKHRGGSVFKTFFIF